MSVKINRNFEVFSPTDFLAAITQHIPDKGVQMVRYYGWYRNKMRGGRQPAFSEETTSNPLRPNIIPPPLRRLPSKKWRDIIMQVWHTDPLRCPVCQNIMRVIGIIDDRRVVEKILRHLALWTEAQPLPQLVRHLAPLGHGPTNLAKMWIPCPITKTSSPIEGQPRPTALFR